jgi:uncharacterized protein YbjT (DUF2867 family)
MQAQTFEKGVQLMILVIGATGNVGSKVVQQLATMGQQVRACVRTAEKATTIQGPGVEIVKGDLEHPETLDAALKGIDKVFLLSPDDPHQVALQGTLIEAAQRGSVRHIVKLSAFSAAQDSPVAFSRWHWQTEQQLKASGLAYTMLRPNIYMQNMVTLFAQSIAAEGVFYLPMQDGKVSMVDTRDIAAVAAAVLTKEGHEGKTYAITGPEALSFSQVAEKLSAALDKKVTYIDPPVDVYKKALLDSGIPEWYADAMIALFRLYSTHFASKVTNVVLEVAKQSPRTFEQFAQDYVQAFKR